MLLVWMRFMVLNHECFDIHDYDDDTDHDADEDTDDGTDDDTYDDIDDGGRRNLYNIKVNEGKT